MTFTWLVFLVQALIARIFSQHLSIGGLPILIVFLTSLFLIFDLSRLNFSKRMFIVLFVGYLFRLLLLFFDVFGRDIFILPNSGLDSEMFNLAALRGLETGDYGRGSIYSYVIGTIYSFFGNERILSQYFNVLISMTAILLIYKTLKMYPISDKVRDLVLGILVFMPNYAIMSSILLRESLLIFLLIFSFYCFTKWLMDRNILLLVPAFGLGLLAAVFHSGAIFIVGAYTVTLIIFNQKKGQFNINFKSVLLAGIFVLLFNVMFQNFSELFLARFSNVDSLTDVTEVYVMGESGYATGFAISQPILNLLVNTPLRMFYFIFSPLPWDWRGSVDVIAFLFSGLFYGGTLFLALSKLWRQKSEQNRYILIILLIIGVGLLFFAWGVSNAGTALRHRDKFIGLFIILFALTIDPPQERSVRP